jgi:membrane associated rhomboid family serine protease
LENLANQLVFTLHIIQQHLPILLMLLAGLWIINIINWSIGRPLFFFGIRPRTVSGLFGIVLAPIPHKDFTHLFYNSIPLVLLASGALVTGWDNFLSISFIIVVVSGVLTWLMGRPGNHIGASGLLMGYWAYLLALAYFLDTGVAFIVGFIAVYYFGSLAANLFPSDEAVSWEGHLFGFIAGVVAAFWQFSGYF